MGVRLRPPLRCRSQLRSLRTSTARWGREHGPMGARIASAPRRTRPAVSRLPGPTGRPRSCAQGPPLVGRQRAALGARFERECIKSASHTSTARWGRAGPRNDADARGSRSSLSLLSLSSPSAPLEKDCIDSARRATLARPWPPARGPVAGHTRVRGGTRAGHTHARGGTRVSPGRGAGERGVR